jgi:AraC-like DNA-binding protein
VLVENKVVFSGPESELSIYDTYQKASGVKLKSNNVLFCAMVTGKKVMHESNTSSREFLPHESFIMAPNTEVEIDFPDAKITQPTTCLAIEIDTDKIKEIAIKLNDNAPITPVFGHWDYNHQLVHTHHNTQTQDLLNRIVNIYTENHQDRSAMIGLAVTELIIRLLRQQTREFILSFCQKEPDNNGLSVVLDYICQNVEKPLDIDYLAKTACMGRTKFFHEFKVHLGCTPVAFQQQLRLKQAAMLIAQGQQITATCFQLGFDNPSHFSRCFKQFYGLTPRLYQKRHASN